MWITGKVDLPQEVLEAHRDGRLVLFVGAGASYDEPSSLPTFNRLASDVAARLGAPNETIERFRGKPDALLGYLAESARDRGGWPVHEAVKALLADPASKPNANHRAIMRIAAASPTMRIVTTNFDDHLTTHAGTAGIDIPDTFYGPALPIGRDFSGLVHLHGSVRRLASELVLTNADFGAAYLTESWAARFLYSMFSKHVVLFIGYSHEDIVMDYLARGLPDSQSRYALTAEPDESHWRPLNITAIEYPKVGEDHSALTEALIAWADRAERGALGHRERIRDIVSAPPTADLVELDYLSELLDEPYGAQAFCEFATHAKWMDWLASADAFQPNFSHEPRTDTSSALARWFAEKATASDEEMNAALNVLRTRSAVSPDFWTSIAVCVAPLSKTSSSRFETWVSVLLSYPTDPFSINDYLASLLNACDPAIHANAALALWRRALNSKLSPRAALFSGLLDDDADGEGAASRRPDAPLVWAIDQYWADEAWSQFALKLGRVGRELLAATEDALRSGYSLLAGYGGGVLQFDSMSFRRTAIETHEQDAHRDVEDTIIDVLRGCIDHLLDSAPLDADSIIASWLPDRHLLFQRLALYALAKSAHDPDSSIREVLTNDLLFAHGLRYEVFHLLRERVPAASPELRNEILAAIDSAELDNDHEAYIRYNLLGWLSESDPTWNEARADRDAIQAANPDFVPRGDPDLVSSMSGGFREYTAPFADDVLAQKLETDAAAALAELAAFEYGDSWADGPRWEDAFEQVTRIVAANQRIGLDIWDALGADASAPRQLDMRRSVVRGWARETLDSKTWTEALARLTSYLELSELTQYTADLLVAGVSKPDTGLASPEIPLALEIADRLWTGLVPPTSPQTTRDWLSLGLNSPEGKLTQFYVRVLSLARVEAGDTWTGLSPEMTARFSRILDDKDDFLGGAKAILGSELRFLFHADETFVVEGVFPIMNLDKGAVAAQQAWDGYLYSARVDLRMLEMGFGTIVAAFRPKVGDLSKELRRQYFNLVADIAGAPSGLAQDPVDFAAMFVMQDAPGITEEYFHSIAHVLDNQNTPQVEETWNRWLGAFMERLSNGTPIALDTKQWSAAAEWLPHLGERFPDGVALLLKHPASLNSHARILHDIAETTVPEVYPTDCARLIAHLVREIENPFWGTHYLRPLVLRLRDQLGVAGITEIVELAMKAGINDAAHWIE